MLQRVMMDGIELPRLYIAENKADAELAKEKGIPFVRWTQGQEALIRMLLRPLLERMFPHINWNKVCGKRRKFKTTVEIYEHEVKEPEQLDVVDDLDADEDDGTIDAMPEQSEPVDVGVFDQAVIDEDGETITELSSQCMDERLFEGGSDMVITHKLDIEDYIGDMSSYVNIEMLQRLRLMPAFIGDILECVKLNVSSGIYWSEGYNKRLGLPVGRFNTSGQLPNLVILDVSGSIPRGISATMITLIDTLRTQLSADLIITSSNSRFYPMGAKLPTPQEIRDQFGYGNEERDFFQILTRHIKGKHYGHVFSFGDNDTPTYRNFKDNSMYSLSGTIVEKVHHYHTGKWLTYADGAKTGYAKWCHMLAKEPEAEYDTSWCEVIR